MTLTKQNKTKGVLYLVAVAIMIALMSIACKNKATVPVGDFSSEGVSEEVAAEEVVAPEETTVQLVYKSDSAGVYGAEIVGSQIKVGYKDTFGGQGNLVISKEGKTDLKANNSSKGYNILKDGNAYNTAESNRFLATEAEAKFDGSGNLTAIVFSGNNGQTYTVNFK